MHLSIIIPAYNEEKRLCRTLLEINSYILAQPYESEIIVVNDGSTDRTNELVEAMLPKIKNLRFIDNRQNHGKGYAVRQGMLQAKGEHRLFTDADNSTSIDHIEKMWPLFERGFDIVIGSRDAKDAEGACQVVAQPSWKRFLGNLGNIGIQLFALWGVWDTQCGFKALTRSVAEDIFKRCKINSWAFDVEVLVLARKLGYKVGVIPVYWIDSSGSKVKLKAYTSFFKELLQIRWNFILHRYKLKETKKII
ncbi:glycosyltransferase family 2 protein [Candidatus Aerophobetes bacterium]|nr:glycosyltransferase family 2 protein [Candidatus Aerophobetes bacterium]